MQTTIGCVLKTDVHVYIFVYTYGV